MDKDLEEIQKFANKLNNQIEDRPKRIKFADISARNEMFESGTKKIKSKMSKGNKLNLASMASMVFNVTDAKKN